MQSIILFGGSFDPPHNGHLKTALQVQKIFSFDQFVFLPCRSPVLKDETKATCQDRIAMLQLALLAHSQFKLDLQEVERETPSYMVDTLRNCRRLYGNQTSLTLLVGMDAFLQLPKWHQWQKIIGLSHIMVLQRPMTGSTKYPIAIERLLKEHQTHHQKTLFEQNFGSIYIYDAGHYELSSTMIRDRLKKNIGVRHFLPSSVYQYIKAHHLYQT